MLQELRVSETGRQKDNLRHTRTMFDWYGAHERGFVFLVGCELNVSNVKDGSKNRECALYLLHVAK
jgi:hypothetical protein